MILKKIIPIALVLFSSAVIAQEQTVEKFKFYGFIRSDMYYNSRQNIEAIEGVFNLAPKPNDYDNFGNDKNSIPQTNLTSITTRMGVDVNGPTIFGAKSSGKIEVDFGGIVGTLTHVVRIRLAYTKLNWDKSELLIGQAWHPMFSSSLPTGPAFTAGAPFQPFNRAPQVKLKYNLTPSFSVSAAAIEQLQFNSSGPIAGTNAYQKNALLPEFFVGLENKATLWTNGIGGEVKTIKPSFNNLTSFGAIAYSHFSNGNFQLKTKGFWGQNMSDQLLPWGYGVTDIKAPGDSVYTNNNMAGGFINAAYGKEIQVGFLIGYDKNLGTESELKDLAGKFSIYGAGSSSIKPKSLGAKEQIMLNSMYRVAPYISYIQSNFRLSLEYELTGAQYGKLNKNGLGDTPYNVNNNRALVSVSYFY